MAKNAFIDPVTGVLKCWGFVEANDPEDIKLPVTEDFGLIPYEWRWDGQQFITFTPPVIVDPKAKAIKDLKVLDPKQATVEDVLVLLKEAL